MDRDQKREQILSIIQAIAMAALEIQPEKRQAFVKRTVATIRRYYKRTHGADPDIADLIGKLPTLAKEMVRILEVSGGTIGHA